jgi:hypothetical protein
MAPNNIDTRRRFILQSIRTCLIAFVLLVSPAPVLALNLPAERDIPVDRESPVQRGDFINRDASETALPDYQSFVALVRNGEKGVLRGVYVPGVLALPIVQQPVGNPGFVSQKNDEVTQFKMAAEAGIVGLLAHNYLSGAIFTNLSIGQEVRLIYGDGAVEYFEIDQILQYQALQPFSPNSEFRDLETNVTITAEQLFGKVYRGEKHVTFQTCIDANGNSSWGRLFVIAQPKLFPHVEQQYIRYDLLPFLY